MCVCEFACLLSCYVLFCLFFFPLSLLNHSEQDPFLFPGTAEQGGGDGGTPLPPPIFLKL